MQTNPLVRFFQSLVNRLIGSGKTRNYISGTAQSYYRFWDLEIPEQVIRQNGTGNAREIVEMCSYCQPVIKAIRVLVDDLFSSADGDDQGVAIANDLGDAKKTPVDPKVQAIGDALLNRIGLENQKLFVKRLLSYGDGFAEKVLIWEGGRYSIDALKVLPTWQLFRVEDDYGNLEGFEQRVSLYGQQTIAFSPPQIVHVRYDREYLYGRGLFDASVQDWVSLKQAAIALSEALNGTVNPIQYVYPASYSAEQEDAFIARKTAEHKDGSLLTLLFTSSDIEVKRLAQGNSNLTSLTDGILYYRRAIKDNSRLPSWFWTDEQVTGGARDIAGQPALTYSRFIASLRGLIGQGLRQAIDTELVLAGYIEPEQRQYRFAWPAIYTDPNSQSSAAEEGEEGTPAPEEQESEIERILVRNGRH